MSKVISFRLDESNPREAEAMEVLKSMQKQGYKLRHILVEALLNLEGNWKKQVSLSQLDDISHQIAQVQDQLANIGVAPFTTKTNQRSQPGLQDSFLNSIRQAAKPGLKIDHG